MQIRIKHTMIAVTVFGWLIPQVTFEAPPGLKKNLLRTYEAWSQEYIAEGTPLRAQLLFILAWFHAVVQVRA